MQKIEISNDQVRAVFNPDWGGHFSALQFNHPDLGWVDIFMTEVKPAKSPEDIPFFGCFNMVPFANRMTNGVVVGANDRFQFPINLPEANLAIHGTGVVCKWAVIESSDTSIVLKHTWLEDDGRYHFEAQLHASIKQNAVNVELRLQNLSTQPLPMGLGFHPWFADIENSEVRFDHSLRAELESPWSVYPSADFDHLPAHFKPSDFHGLDSSFEGWNGHVEVCLKAISTDVELSAKDAVNKMHVFVMGQNDRFCLEPVSHKPGRLEDETACIQPGEQISGTMILAMKKIK